MKYAGGNKGQWFPTKKEHEGSGEGWGLWCKKKADGRVQVSSVSGIGGAFSEPLVHASLSRCFWLLALGACSACWSWLSRENEERGASPS